MTKSVSLQCKCGKVHLEVLGEPILASECCCNSCREAGEKLRQLTGASRVLGPHGQTPFVLYRKDRVRFVSGMELLREFRLTPEAKTRRVVASCCNTAVFLEFQHGHWLSLYGALWPEGALPPMQMRTMTSDLPDPSVLPADIPNARTQSPQFMWKLLKAWAAMGFRSPKIAVAAEIGA